MYSGLKKRGAVLASRLYYALYMELLPPLPTGGLFYFMVVALMLCCVFTLPCILETVRILYCSMSTVMLAYFVCLQKYSCTAKGTIRFVFLEYQI